MELGGVHACRRVCEEGGLEIKKSFVFVFVFE